MSTPFFSVIVPVYKTEAYVEECICSILRQSFTNYELILVDDGSPDNAPQICAHYAKSDSRIRLINKSNGGLSTARNSGLDKALGDYVLFIDSDDRYHDDDVFNNLSNFLICESKPDIAIFGVEKFGNFSGEIARASCFNGNYSFNGTYPLNTLIRNNAYIASACNKAVKRLFIEKHHLRFPVGKLSEDIEWSANILANNPTTAAISQIYYDYRKGNSQSITSNIGIRNINDVLSIILKYKNTENELLLNYIANEYVLLLTLSNKLKHNEYLLIKNELKKLWWLLEYNEYPYTRKVSLIKFLGFDVCRFLLGLYKKIKN